MDLARVLGDVVASAHHPDYDGRKLLVVQPLDPKGRDLGKSYLAVDVAQAGPGDIVMVMREGNGVRQVLGGQPPIRSLVIGIVDAVETDRAY